MSNPTQGETLLSYDFEHRFPHRFWISNWTSDDTYPSGFRYKLLSARDTSSDEIDFLVVVQSADGTKTVLKHLGIAASAFDRTTRIFVDGLAERHRLNFEQLDLTDVRTAD